MEQMCMVNAQGEMLEILEVDREPLEGELKVPSFGYYEVFNVQRYPKAKYDFNIKTWVGVGEPTPIPTPEPSEVEILKAKIETLESDNLIALEALTSLYEMMVGGGV